MYKQEILDKILEGSLQNHTTHMSGTYKGYYITLKKFAFHLRARIAISHLQSQERKNLEAFLTNLIRTQKNLVGATVEGHGVTLNIKSPVLSKTTPDILNSNIFTVIDYLIKHEFKSGCMECGTISDQLSCEEIYFEYFYLCDTCKNKNN